jgi:hypothetical protein
MSIDDALWDHPGWKERDTPWTAGCRWLQSWWRANQLRLPPGELSAKRRGRFVASMLPLGTDRAANFFGTDVLAAFDSRLAEGNHSGIINEDRLLRNLLSSRPTCFNLFGPFVADPSLLLDWVKTIDPEAERVDRVRFEWAPNRKLHFGGGSAFDAFVEYTARGRRFLGVECKYAEDLEASSIAVRPPYIEFTEASSEWREGASRRLDVARLRQLWLNTLLAQSLIEREDSYERGTVVVVACAADRTAREATALVRGELHKPDAWLCWSPYEEVIASVRGHDAWAAWFRRRYLDFTPIRHLLRDDDPRVQPDDEPTVRGLHDLLAIGQRVTGEGSVLEQIVNALTDRRMPGASTVDLDGLNARAAQLAVDLKTWRQAAYDVWQDIEETWRGEGSQSEEGPSA